MQERLIAFFATREAAENAAESLRYAHVPPESLRIVQAEAGTSFDPKDYRSAKRRRESPGLLDSMRGLLAELGLMDARRAVNLDDVGRSCLEEGVCRGGTVLRVEVDAGQAPEIMNLLSRHDALDIAEYAASWRNARKRAAEQGASTAAGAPQGPETQEVTPPLDAAATHPFNELTSEMRERLIAEEAYLVAERRGFAGDLALEDWLEAERRVDARLQSKVKREA